MKLKKKPMTTAVSLALFASAFTFSSIALSQTAPADPPKPAAASPADAEKLRADAVKKAAEDARAAVQSLETVLVTSSKRSQAAYKVPYNVTAISEEALREANITDAKKLIQQDASINAPSNSARFADSVTVRGLNVSPVNANNLEQFVRTTLAYYLDDTPLPNMGYRIKDIARVEKLLGPQGTLYGAGSLGGTIRYITNEPKLNTTEARISTSIYRTQGGGLSTDSDLMFNAPLNETMALRGSIAFLDEKGYTDRVSNPPWRLGQFAWVTQPDPNRNVYADDDWQRVGGGRLSLLWKIHRDVDLKFSHTEQNQKANGTTATSLLPLNIANSTTPAQVLAAWRNGTAPCTGAACRYTFFLDTPPAVNDNTVLSRYPEYADRRLTLDAFDINWNLGFATLHSSTSGFKDIRDGVADYASQGEVFYFQLGDLGAKIDSGRSAFITFNNRYKGFSHETRLTSTGEGPIQWIAGLYHTKQERSLRFSEFLPGMDAYVPLNRGQIGGLKDEGYRENLGTEYTETALFGELSYKPSKPWLITLGARVFNYEDTAIADIIDYAGGFVDSKVNVTRGENGKSFFKLNVSYQFNDDLLAYGTFSQGFRRGGTNGFKDQGTRKVADNVQKFEPDSTDNYELGLKGYLFNRQLYVQADVFRIKWKNVQTYFAQDVNGFPVNGTANGPDAQTEGFEISTRFKLSNHFQATYSGTTTEGKWAETKRLCLYTNGTSCRTWSKDGELGATPKWKHNFGIRYSNTLADDTYVYASVNGRHVDKVGEDRADDPATVVRARPAYNLFNVSTGMSFGKWDLGLWVENVANTRAELSGQAAGIMGPRVIYTTPRTIGTNISYNFK